SFNIYSCKKDLEEEEAPFFNDLLIFPFLKSVARAVVERDSKSGANFKMGEAPLQAMVKQLNDQDMCLLNKLIGMIKFCNLERIKVLLLETSSRFGCTGKSKGSFDHHNGRLPMINVIADRFYLGTIKTFSKLKMLFIHASGIKTIYAWSLRYAEEGSAYEMWLEGAQGKQQV
ncbi:hypothetical protein BCV71DRAFT_285510, partial [Rhizopus microsporus]